ncbi:hypothetical protein [Paraburkholderia solisilvae]|uniref:Prevent-host-death protein n=1 Tax=Paraburkholderia solisilvae TaxID=624376 RepID=A0A6J5EYG5_9BURK|nr:hypothetical protein [Paraburkholderia solisilvae]CAB3770507.1 hypothetical protein LMG29739_05804 [Paraburkholderia solisilvae]
MPELVRITADAIFNREIFPRVSVAQPADGSRKRAVRGVDPDEPAIDPRQIDMWVDAPPAKPERTRGALRGQVQVADDFDAPLPADLLSAFEGD